MTNKTKRIPHNLLTTDEWIRRAIAAHGDEFDYSKVEYVNQNTKVCIIDRATGEEFWQLPNVHLITGGRNYHTITFEEFLRYMKEYFPNNYDEYSFDESTFVNMKKKMKVFHNGKEEMVSPRNLLMRGRHPIDTPELQREYDDLKELISHYKYQRDFRDEHPDKLKRIKDLKWWELTDTMIKRGKEEFDHEELAKLIREQANLGYSRSWFCRNYSSQYTYIKKNKLEKLFDDNGMPYRNPDDQGIYAYEFVLDNGEKWVYVGLTQNFVVRDSQHRMECVHSAVREFADKHNLEIPEMKIIIDYEDCDLAAEDEGKILDDYVNKGWNKINRIRTGSIGGGHHASVVRQKKYDMTFEEYQKFIKDNNITTRSYFRSHYVGYCKAAIAKGFLDDLLPMHPHSVRSNYPFKECFEDAKKYNNNKEWEMNSPRHFHWSNKMRWTGLISFLLKRSGCPMTDGKIEFYRKKLKEIEESSKESIIIDEDLIKCFKEEYNTSPLF